MLNDMLKYLENKKILILGFGREGKSTYRFIRKYFPKKKLYIADKEEIEKSILENDKNVEIKCGLNYCEDLEEYDIVMKTPGISFVGVNTSEFEDKIKSELELFLEFIDCITIGVTGTKGKSTTSSLLYEIIKKQDENTILLGNIGVPIFDAIENINENTKVVLEISSHQLEYIKKSPKIAILLNIYEEHLDHYNSFMDYAMAKMNIAKYQNNENYFIYNSNSEMINKCMKKLQNTNNIKYAVSFNGTKDKYNGIDNNVLIKDNYITINDKKVYDINQKRKIIGSHNLNNIMFALAVCEILKLNINKTIDTINNFQGLEHRIEYVRNL